MGINHIAIILDGNRRYGDKVGIGRFKGHEKGADAMRNLLNWEASLSEAERQKYFPKILTFYIFSMQNFNRPEHEKQILFRLFQKAFAELLTSKEVVKLQLRVDFLGRLQLLPAKLQGLIREVREKTKHYTRHKLNFCIAYGGREEVLDAVNKIIEEGRTGPVTEEEFGGYLYTDDNVDIAIRTSGEYRTSNFLMWQSHYAEWFFLKETWPEFTPELFKSIIDEYTAKRERRFGK